MIEESEAGRIAAAYDLLGTPLARSDASPLTFSRVSSVLGVSRSVLYAHWDTSADFAEDVVAELATDRSNWQLQLAQVWDGRSFADALAGNLDLAVARPGSMRRAGASARPRGSRARGRLAAWERSWLVLLSDRLRLEYGPAPDHVWDDLAVAVTALVDGLAMFTAVVGTSAGVLEVAPTGALVAEVTEGMVRHLVGSMSDMRGPDLGDDGGDSEEPLSPRGRAILEESAGAVRAGELTEGGADRRLVDGEVLARTLGISSRRLYQIWPTPIDLNAALFGECLRRVQAAVQAQAIGAFTQVSGAASADAIAEGLLRWNEQQLDLARLVDADRLLGLLELATSDEVAERYRADLDSWAAEGKMLLAAVLQVRGRQMVPGRTIADWFTFSVSFYLGALRLLRTHDGLRSRTCTYRGLTVAPLAAAMDVLSELWTAAPDAGA